MRLSYVRWIKLGRATSGWTCRIEHYSPETDGEATVVGNGWRGHMGIIGILTALYDAWRKCV